MNNFSISENNFTCPDIGCGDRLDTIYLLTTTNMSVTRNIFNGSQMGIQITGGTYLTTISNNTFTRQDRSIVINGNNPTLMTHILNNVFYNISNNIDYYAVALEIINASMINISNNTFYQMPDVILEASAARNVYIDYNNVSIVCNINRSTSGINTAVHSQNEPCTAWFFGQRYKGWNYFVPGNSSNITIGNNNIYDNGVEVYVFGQGMRSMSLSLPTYWYRSFYFTNLTNITELYINPLYDNIISTNPSQYGANPAYSTYIAMTSGGALNGSLYGFYNITQQTMKFGSSTQTATFKLNLSNLSVLYPYNDILNFSNSVAFSLDSNNYSIDLISGQVVIVGDYSCDKHWRDSSMSYTCNSTACYFTNTNCTIKTGRTG
jgi:hypothetical protein